MNDASVADLGTSLGSKNCEYNKMKFANVSVKKTVIGFNLLW